ncbi:MAG: Riboflavin transporter RibZ [Pseudomonas fluorescens]|nr:MAG: Riboflavin transporter RibZ [Pseudomonas fluorescens]
MNAHASPGALTALSFSLLLASLGTSIANVGLPSLVQVFSATFEAVQWVVLAYLLAVTLAIVAAGRLGDRFGRRRLLLAGLLLFTLASALCGLAPSLGGLIAARALQGLGAAMMMAMTMALVSDTVPKSHTGRAMGLLGTASAVGTPLGPSAGGMLLGAFGWPALFFISVPLGLIALGLVHRWLHAAGQTGSRAGFSFRHALGDRHLRAGMAMSGLVSAVMMATLMVGPFYLTHVTGLVPGWMGLTMAMGPCVSALSGVPAGRLTDRFGSRFVTRSGLLTMAVGCTLLLIAPQGLGVFGYLGPLVVLTLGYAQFQAANNTGVMSDVPADRRGVIAGLLNLSRNVGLMGGAKVLGAAFAWVAGDLADAAPHTITTGMHATFALALGLIGTALLFARTTRPATTPVTCG